MTTRRLLIAAGSLALLTSACTTTSRSAAADDASKRQSIDAAVDGALTQLYAQVPSAQPMVAKAQGVLVFPSVISAGFIVGGSYGQGALLERGRNRGYYSTATGSFGWLAGADSKAIYVLFMTEDALERFKASKGWTAGVDASVTMVRVGASLNIDTQTAQSPVVGFVLSNGGLMANLSLDGTKITRLML